ncbi:MAG: hypothetical protein JSS66_02450 [Armatimonadetes bacterium]|nr:hypothetical protein [Armatimonadota bacterium]
MATVPPPFEAPPVPRATNSANKACLAAILLVACACLVICGIGAFSFKGFFDQAVQTASCAEMFDMAHKATLAYAKTHAGKFPPAATWEDDIQPYYKNLYDTFAAEASHKKLPKGAWPPAPGEALVCKWQGRTTGIAYNNELANKFQSSFKDPSTTAVVFEVDGTGRNQTEKYVAKPKASAPKIFYNERDWIVFFIDGNKNPLETSGSNSIKISVDDGLDKSSTTDSSSSGNKTEE